MLKLYGDIISDQEKRGFIEKVETSEISNRMPYIPHHAVKKDSATTPLRIVYDCNCREAPDAPSLNDCLVSMPPMINMINDLTGIITRLIRKHKYAVSTDIEKAFLQIGLNKNDRHVTRFMWLSDPSDPTSELVTYRFKVILFGTTCSPYILNATLMKHLKNNPTQFTDALKRNLYVDNILTSFPEELTLLSFYKESCSLLAKGGFNLRSWSSNSSELQNVAQLDNCNENDKIVKILGLRWNVDKDNISFQTTIADPQQSTTKCDVLRESSKIFDPLGIISPVTVRAKILMQN